MSDERLRDLERKFRESGAVEIEAAYLAEKIRTGTLDRNALTTAAKLGHPAAQAVMPEMTTPSAARSLFSSLELSSQECVIRAYIALAQACLSAWENSCPHDTRPRQAVNAVIEWLRCPCEAHRSAFVQAGYRIRTAMQMQGVQPGQPAYLAADVAYIATESTSFWASAGPELSLIELNDQKMLDEAIRAVGEEAIELAIRRSLIPWLLGYNDPLCADSKQTGTS